MSYFVKIRQLEAELFDADGRKDRQADMAKLIVAFRSYEIEQYGAKGIITFKSTTSTAKYSPVETTV
jgi:hypothetical protein